MREKTVHKETSKQGEITHELSSHLDRWLRWFRLRRAAAWAVRGLAIGLALGLLISLAAIFRGLLLNNEFLTLLISFSAGGLLLGGGFALAWPISRLKAARDFDLRFGLQERISTALEWAEKTDLPREQEDLRSKQLADALAAARRVDVRARLPLRIAWQEILLVLLFTVGAVLASFWGRPNFQAAQEKRAVQEAIAEETTRIKAVLEEIHSASELTPQQKEVLAAPLEEARRQLEQAQTLEQSVSILTRAEGELRSQSDAESQAQAQTFREIGQDWSQSQNSPLQSAGEQLAGGDAPAAAQAINDLDLSQMGQAEREALARQLEQAASSLALTDPDLAEHLNAAAGDLRAGDTQAAQQDLEDAAKELSEAGGRIEGSAQAGKAAAEVGAARERLLQQAGGGTQASAGSALGEGQSRGDDQAGSTAGQGVEDGQQSESGDQNGAGGGAGRGEGAGETGTGGTTGADSIDQGNSPGNGGVRPFEPISPPQQLGGSGGEVVTLPPSGQTGDLVTGEGELPFDQPGRSQVPYTDVYPQYAQAYRQAIESGQVPLHLRPLVRDYFSSLEPPPEP